jgi:opacity protein-like surface antigen
MKQKHLALVSLAILSLAPMALAQTWEVGASVGASILTNDGLGQISVPVLNGRSSMENGFRIGFRGTYNPNSFLGHEFSYSYNDSGISFDVANAVRDASIHQFAYNVLIYPMPRSSPIRPFVTGGAHINRYSSFSDIADLSSGTTKAGFNWGGGVKWKVLPLVLLRFDFRQYLNGKPYNIPDTSGLLHQNEVSLGISLDK